MCCYREKLSASILFSRGYEYEWEPTALVSFSTYYIGPMLLLTVSNYTCLTSLTPTHLHTHTSLGAH